MSIKLKVDPYCENCPHFEADVNTEMVVHFNEILRTDTYITCKNKDKCEQIMDYLSKVR